MKIKVTQLDVETGVACSPHCCPIALAIKRECPNVCVIVNSNTAWFGRKKRKLPRDAQKFVYAFDEGEYVKPFEFDL